MYKLYRINNILQNVKENEEWNRCRRANGDILTLCIYDCNDNKSCEDQCTADHKIRQADCPCEVRYRKCYCMRHKLCRIMCMVIQANCSAGCPCSDFDCLPPTTTTTTKTTTTTTLSPTRSAVLVLSTMKPLENRPFIVDFDGKYSMFFSIINFSKGNVNADLNFEYGDDTAMATVYTGCGATLHNEFWYFGSGSSLYKRQVKLQKCPLNIYLIFQANKIVGCKLERQTDMNFNFGYGSCNTFNEPNQKVLLCFDYDNSRECHT